MVKKFQMKNGLSVVLVESHKSPVVSVQMWVRTGSADETPGLRGISHFIEHLVFKGSEKYGVGQIAATVEGSGGELNAYTSFDQTVFYVTISSQFLDVGMDVISQMMGKPAFVASEIDNEREVVIEEIKRSLDSSHRQGSRLLFESMYKRHPYGEPVIGFEEIIRKVSREDIVKYFNDRYCAKNMTLLLVGDFASVDIKKKAQQYFGGMRSGKPKKIRRPKEALHKNPSVAVRGSTFAENFLFLAWPAPAADHKDIAALDTLAMILGQGESSRLNEELRLKRQLVNFAGSSVFSPQDPGFFTISASLPPGALAPALEQIQLQWQRILESPVSGEELAKAVVNLHSDQYYTLETVDGMARRYGHFEHLFRDYRYFDKFLKSVRKLKPADVQAVAKKYLKPERLQICALTPDKDKDTAEKTLKAWAKKLNINPKAKSNEKLKKRKANALPKSWFPPPGPRLSKGANQTQKIVLNNGATLLLRPNFDTPVMSLRAGFLGGSRVEARKHQGLNELMSRVWVSATRKREEVEVLAQMEAMAASISGYGGRNTAGLTLSVLEPFVHPMLELFGEILIDAHLKEDIIRREKALMMEQLRIRLDNPAQIAVLNFMATIFGDHPYGRDSLGRIETLDALGPDEVVGHLATMRSAHNLVIAVTGHFDSGKVVKYLEGLTNELPAGKKLMQPLPLHVPSSSQKCFVRSEKEQVHLIMGYPGLTFSDPDRYALQVLEAVLAGQGGRLFVELRDKASLAYSVSPLRMEGIETGYFGAYIGCSPDKGTKALRMLREQFRQAAAEQISNDELVRAQRYLIGRHDIDLQKNAAMAAALLFNEIYGIDHSEVFMYPERIREVSTEDILRVSQRLFGGAEIVSAVGPREPWAEPESSLKQEINL